MKVMEANRFLGWRKRLYEGLFLTWRELALILGELGVVRRPEGSSGRRRS